MFVSDSQKMVPTIKRSCMINVLKPFIDIVFPAVCACCGSALQQSESSLCVWCAESRFEKPGEIPLILPQSVDFVFSMWQFDKGGYLQDLLHSLKYNFLKGVGTELGCLAGRAFLETAEGKLLVANMHERTPVIVPVPLHRSKERKRGYNQARALAGGFAEATGWEISYKDCIQRVRKTKTQTGLTTEQRANNLRGAFHLKNGAALQGKYPIIIDDVFTTGATTFMMADVLCRPGETCGIVTVAQA
jgi:ComF family protein